MILSGFALLIYFLLHCHKMTTQACLKSEFRIKISLVEISPIQPVAGWPKERPVDWRSE